VKLDESQIKKQLSIAFENHKNKKFQTAEKIYKEILSLNKNHLEANFNLGTLYSQLKKYDLEFLGFTNLAVKKEYSKYYPSDFKNTSLENWNEFEINNPNIFKKMYQLWLKKNE